ncbi:uncharacterized protein FYW61_012597 isoform 2-T2 [Anableps anableps]
MFTMRRNSATGWKKALTNILEELTQQQFKKMLECLEKIPKSVKTTRSRECMAQTIIEHYGEDGSVTEIENAMEEIPRRDDKVQDLLRPFVEKHERSATGAPAGKDARSSAGQANRKRQRGPQPKMDSGGPMKAKKKKTEKKATSPPRPSAALQTLTPDLRETIRDLKVSGQLSQKLLAVKVVHKSDLHQYQVKNKNKEIKTCFYLGVADETDAIKVQVYGQERYPAIQEGHFYTFRDVLMDRREKVVKVTQKTKVSKTGSLDVPKNVELEAGKLIFSPVYTVRKVQTFPDRKEVSVEGTVKEIGAINSMLMKAKRMKKDKQDFELEDGTGSITISLWGEDTRHLGGISVGDVVRVNNLKTNLFKGTVSLNSTDSTRTTKVQSAAVQNVTIRILGICKFDRSYTELEAEINKQMKTLKVASPLLAEGVGLRLGDDFEDKLLQKVPFPAEAQIQGNEIKQLKAQA